MLPMCTALGCAHWHWLTSSLHIKVMDPAEKDWFIQVSEDLSLDPYREDSLWHMPCTECHLPLAEQTHTFLPTAEPCKWPVLAASLAVRDTSLHGYLGQGHLWGQGCRRAQMLFCAQTSDTLKTWVWNLVYFKDFFLGTIQLSKA